MPKKEEKCGRSQCTDGEVSGWSGSHDPRSGVCTIGAGRDDRCPLRDAEGPESECATRPTIEESGRVDPRESWSVKVSECRAALRRNRSAREWLMGVGRRHPGDGRRRLLASRVMGRHPRWSGRVFSGSPTDQKRA